ncbi:ribbon-helix-helix protein, CopG family [Agaribacter flavus]|uniref:Ribbon-helix-helix protein, CopG family n=1 Tax=Agaribacter flavus TaxID=1902781 RepID=A0ABV7FSD3_9ALTE
MSKFTVSLSADIDKRLTEIAAKEGITKSEAVRRAMALLSMAEKEKEKGNSLAIVRENPDSHEVQVIGRVVGL